VGFGTPQYHASYARDLIYFVLHDHVIIANVLELNIFAPLIGVALTLLLLRGTEDSATFNNIMAVVNVVMLCLFVGVGMLYNEPANWDNLAPQGFGGVLQASGLMFYSFVGFDAVCTLSQEALNPQFAIPAGMLGSLAVVTALYCAVSASLVGMTPLAAINKTAPLSQAFLAHGLNIMFHMVTIAAVTNTLATAFSGIMAQPRLWMCIGQDGLAPASLSKLDRKGVPRLAQTVAGVLAAMFCCFFPISFLANLCSAGILFAYIMVCIALLILRWGNVLDDDDEELNSPAFSSGLFTLLIVLNIAFPVSASVLGLDTATGFYSCCGLSAAFVCMFLYHYMRYGQGQSFDAIVKRDSGIELIGAFKCPGFPATPCIGIVVNAYVMSGMGVHAIVATSLYILFGVGLWLSYGYENSKLKIPRRK